MVRETFFLQCLVQFGEGSELGQASRLHPLPQSEKNVPSHSGTDRLIGDGGTPQWSHRHKYGKTSVICLSSCASLTDKHQCLCSQSFRLQRLHVLCEVSDALVNFVFMALTDLPEYRTPYWHFFVTVCPWTCLSPECGGNMIRGELSAVLLRECCQIRWRFLQRARGWSSAFAVRAVADGAVVHEHFFPRCRRGCRDRAVLDDLILCYSPDSTSGQDYS